jgi:hypothetical protein
MYIGKVAPGWMLVERVVPLEAMPNVHVTLYGTRHGMQFAAMQASEFDLVIVGLGKQNHARRVWPEMKRAMVRTVTALVTAGSAFESKTTSSPANARSLACAAVST